jgi:hypothetical protein
MRLTSLSKLRLLTGGAQARRVLSLVVASMVLLLALAPQIYLWLKQGRNWNGAFVYYTTDERAYAAYVNALNKGRPRLNDPYTGRDDRRELRQPESIFSIQFVPPYTLVSLMRLFPISTSACFFILLCACAVATVLVLFHLILSLTGDARLAAAGTLVVLCLGTLSTSYGIWDSNNLFARVHLRHMPFLRRYLPAFVFPFFLGFFALVWRMLTRESERESFVAAALAGFVFALLVFSYFFVWTAAAAWFACIAVIWLAAKRGERRRTLKLFGVVCVIGGLALVPYAFLLARRSNTMESAQLLVKTHTPDLLRVPEVIGFILLALLFWAGRRGLISFREHAALFAGSFALLPCLVFNQQVLTGHSLQPVHYGTFVVNYCVLLAAVLCAGLVRTRPLPARLLLLASLSAFGWASLETALWVRRVGGFFIFQDKVEVAAGRLAELGSSRSTGTLDSQSLVFSPSILVSDLLPTIAPQPVLWAPHMVVFPGASAIENRERLLHQFYLAGVDLSDSAGRDFESLELMPRYYFSLLLGQGWINRDLRADWSPVTRDELQGALNRYRDYASSFDRERARRLPISYVLIHNHQKVDLSRLDRWYERDAGEQVGDFTLYRVRLRP